MPNHPSRPILTFLKSNWFLVLFLGLFIILRIPSLFEPHWYGDEGIYASVAMAIEHGKKLYIDVFDNRLPFIYYLYTLADTGNRLLMIRIFSLVAGVVSLVGIYFLGKRLQLKNAGILVMLVATWFLGSPRFEGNIANTENFFLPLTIWALWFGLAAKRRDLFIAGLLFGTAFTIKFMPFFTLLALGIYILATQLYKQKEKVQYLFLLGVGFAIPIAVVFLFLYFNGDLQQAVQFGLLNNTSYVAEYSNEGIKAIWKVVGLGVSIVGILLFYRLKKFSSTSLFIFLLLAFDFYATIFSGRKYEHYLLQIVPSLSLLAGALVAYIVSKAKVIPKILYVLAFIVVILSGRYIFYKGTDTAIDMNIPNYYREFVQASLGMHYDPSLPFTFYREPPKLKIAQYIVERYNTRNIFFYSNVSWIYDYSHIVPPTFYVAAYHQYLVPNGPDRMITDLQRSRPAVIAVDKQVEVTKEMKTYLETFYTKDLEDTYFVYYIPKQP